MTRRRSSTASTRTGWAATLALAVVACGGPVDPGKITEALTERIETDNIVLHFSPGDSVEPGWQQQFHDWISGQLGVTLPVKLKYYKYKSRAQMKAITGRETNGFAEPAAYAVHSIFPRDGHEAIHVYSARVGRPSSFFNEGIAVGLNPEPATPGTMPLMPQWNGMYVHDHVRMLMRTDRFVGIGGMVTTAGFREVDEWIGYGEAGSFVHFMIEEFGLPPMLEFFRRGTADDDHARITGLFESIWGISLGEAEARWIEMLEGGARS